MDVGYILRRVTKDYCNIEPDKVAVQIENEPGWTYRELDVESNRYANAFLKMGIKKGDRIGVLLYNCLEYWAVYFAAAKIGAIVVRINFRLVSEELNYILNDSGAKILIFENSLVDRIQPILKHLPVTNYFCRMSDETPCPDWSETLKTLDNNESFLMTENNVHARDPLMLMYTSGTTGRPKGAIWTHENTLWYASQQIMKWSLNSSIVTMSPGPMYHVGAFEKLSLPALLLGGKVINSKSKGFETRRYLNIIKHQKVNFAGFFPFILYELLNLTEKENFSLPHLKEITVGGEPVFKWAFEKMKLQYPTIKIWQIYGLTEGSPTICTLAPEDNISKGHTVGKPFPLVELKIIDDKGREVKQGEPGEIWTKNPVVAKEYWNMPKETAETFVNGWYGTGDMGKIDEDGYLIITGRKKDMIRSGGENIYPAELENILSQHPWIKEVAIIGVPDVKYTETVCAVIVLKEKTNLTAEQVIKYCREHMAGYKVPKYIEFLDTLPRTPSGKVMKYKLREKYEIQKKD